MSEAIAVDHKEDMSPTGFLRLYMQTDGDVIVSVTGVNMHDEQQIEGLHTTLAAAEQARDDAVRVLAIATNALSDADYPPDYIELAWSAHPKHGNPGEACQICGCRQEAMEEYRAALAALLQPAKEVAGGK